MTRPATVAPRSVPRAAPLAALPALPWLAGLLWAASMASALAQALPAGSTPAPVGAGSPPSPQRAFAGGGTAASVRAEPVVIEAQTLSGEADRSARAEGGVELRKGSVVLRADRVSYDVASDRAVADGGVTVTKPGVQFRGPRLELQVEAFEGFMLEPAFELERSRSGGRARRLDFQGSQRFSAERPVYTSCPRDGSADPDWLLMARALRVDLQANEAVAESARLYFMGVPVLALPTMSFPATGDRKSGWLPPRLRNDSRSGLQVALPYYWNIAPERDATFTPYRSARRGYGLDSEVRYLGLGGDGQLAVDLLPSDALTQSRRYNARGRHEGALPAWDPRAGPGWLELSGARVSDQDWWKDFQALWLPLAADNPWWRESRSSWMPLTPRLMPLRARAEQPLLLGDIALVASVEATRWQVLQTATEPMAAPYDRMAFALSTATENRGDGVRASAQAGASVFSLPLGPGSSTRPTGRRLHLVAQLSRRVEGAAFWVEPTISANAVAYDLDQPLPDGRSRLSRSIPSLALDAGTAFERETFWFGRAMRQTLEPRLMVLRTPYREQSPYLLFDSAGKDFSSGSIFTLSDYSGVDRVPDAHHVNAGAVNRFVDAASGEETFRLEVVQRYLLGTQRITPEGEAYVGRSSDLLVLGSARVVPHWGLSAWLRWNAQTRRPVRSILSATYAPDPQRHVSAAYRFSRGLAEQLETTWKWPLGRRSLATADASRGTSACSRQWTTVGEGVYSAVERRLTRALVGLELDAGCWSTRLVAIRQASGIASTTIVQFQVELKGLSGDGAAAVRSGS